MQLDDKVKVSDKISFPLSLDLRTLMPTAFEEGLASKYELSAILIHKGRGAHQGHYGVPLPSVLGRQPITQVLYCFWCMNCSGGVHSL